MEAKITMFGVVVEQAVVENLAGHGIEACVGLVEQGDLGSRRQPDDDPEG
jgi:hypothetical protein